MSALPWHQWLILTAGVLAILLSQLPAPAARRWAPVVGLISQPAWIYAALIVEQWANLVCSLLILLIWILGIWWQWIRAPRSSTDILTLPPRCRAGGAA